MPSAAPSRALHTYQQTRYTISTTNLRRCNAKHSLPPHRIPRQTIHYYTPGRASNFRRVDSGQGYTSSYDPDAPPRGTLHKSPASGVPKLIPRELKKYLDKYVVGQVRSKVYLSTALYNHHLLTLRRQRLAEEEEERIAKKERLESSMQPDDPEPIPSNLSSSRSFRHDRYQDRYPEKRTSPSILLEDNNRAVNIQKSNVLMLGPTGVGKTLIVQTLAQVLDIPIAMCDCTSLTQAGYVGDDVETSVGRLLAAAQYDTKKAENGIIFFDELDKLAATKVTHGKDVSGEGVQQALLKLIEGNTIQINTKQGRGGGRNSNTSIPNSLLAVEENYVVQTDNILFIFAGAFVGLDKIVRDRISKSSIGFGSPLRNTSTSIPSKSEAALIRKSLPFFSSRPEEQHTILDLVDPEDLRQFGFIPELIGRIPTITALTQLSIDDLMSILTDTKDCKTQQYIALFQESGVELRFTTPALREIAQRALEKGTGARGLDTVMRNILTDAMYETPKSSTKFVLVNKAAAKLEKAPMYFARGQESTFLNVAKREEEEWAAEKAKNEVVDGGGLEEYRVQAKAGM